MDKELEELLADLKKIKDSLNKALNTHNDLGVCITKMIGAVWNIDFAIETVEAKIKDED